MKLILLFLFFLPQICLSQFSKLESFGLNGKVKSIKETTIISGLNGLTVTTKMIYEFDKSRRVISLLNLRDNSITNYYYEKGILIKEMKFKGNELFRESNYTRIEPHIISLEYKDEKEIIYKSTMEIDSKDRIKFVKNEEGNYSEIYKFNDLSIAKQRMIIVKSDTMITNYDIIVFESDKKGNWIKYESTSNQSFPISKCIVEREINYR